MDPEPASLAKPSLKVDSAPSPSRQGAVAVSDDDDPYSLRKSSITLLGVTIAIATLGAPISAVLLERTLGQMKVIVPNSLEHNGTAKLSYFQFLY